MRAVDNGGAEIVRLLLCEKDIKNTSNQTALDIARRRSNQAIVDLLSQ